jgi:hypothetical protein
MDQQPEQRAVDVHDDSDAAPATKHPWQEPKLIFVEPKLTHHGTVQEVTGQSFGTFIP